MAAWLKAEELGPPLDIQVGLCDFFQLQKVDKFETVYWKRSQYY